MQRRYISSVTPLDGHVLQIDYVSGSRVMLDMTPLLESIRFRPLKRPESGLPPRPTAFLCASARSSWLTTKYWNCLNARMRKETKLP